MSLKHAVLVLLESEGGTGYDIVKSFSKGLGYFWNASHQQVYQELKKLNADGLLECHTELQNGKPDKKIYAVTSKGRESLHAWLDKPAKLSKVNDALLVKLYAGDLNDIHSLRKEVQGQRAHYADMLESFLVVEQQYLTGEAQQRQQWRMPYLTLKRGIYSLQAWLLWADDVLQELQAQD